MKKRFPLWTLGLLGIILVILVPVLYFLPRAEKRSSQPADHLPKKPVHVDHSDIVKGEFKTGQDVTRACLECHEDAAARIGPEPMAKYFSLLISHPAYCEAIQAATGELVPV